MLSCVKDEQWEESQAWWEKRCGKALGPGWVQWPDGPQWTTSQAHHCPTDPRSGMPAAGDKLQWIRVWIRALPKDCDLGTLLTRTGLHVLFKLSDEDIHIHFYNVSWLPIALRSRGAWHVDRAYLVFKECLSILPFLRETVLSLVQLLSYSTNIYWATLGCHTLLRTKNKRMRDTWRQNLVVYNTSTVYIFKKAPNVYVYWMS